MKGLISFLALFSLVTISVCSDADGVYKVGVGIGDITGPPAGIVLNGYVNPIMNAAGIHTRQYARAFVVESLDSPNNVIAYVTCDMGMMDHTIKVEVLKRLGPRFHDKNVMISATHTHSGVSGFMTYFAYLIIESYGFNQITFWAAVDGITEAIREADATLQNGKLYSNRGELLGVNRNRAETEYAWNPQEERDKYPHTVDKDMTLLKITVLEGEDEERPIGAFTWWPVHPISFNGGFNPLVSSDSKGYAALMFDYLMNPGERPGKGRFVSGFGSSNLGDVSASCPDPLGRIDFSEDLANVKCVGEKQYEKAKELFEDTTGLMHITGPIKYAHQFINTTEVEVDSLKLCKGALGYNYVGVDPEEWPFIELIRDLIKEPSPEMVQCQLPKGVALAAGEMDQPWEWAPSIIGLQILQAGSLDLVGIPGEYTTMAGRRVRNAVFNVTGHEVVVAGLANGYINYIATPEEYDALGYEGGATVYGRNTLPVTVGLFRDMAQKLKDDEEDTIDDGPTPPNFLDIVREDIAPWRDPLPANGLPFGNCNKQPNTVPYKVGHQVLVEFNAGSPRNSPLRGGTFLLVEQREEGTGTWKIYRTDSDVDTLFWWDALRRIVQVQWVIPEGTPPGIYRIRHFGYHRDHEDGPFTNYVGVTDNFEIEA